MFEHKVAVQQDGLDFGQEGIVPVDVGPARLHHADPGIGEMVDHLHQPVRRGRKVRVEDGDELALGAFQARLQRARLEAAAVAAVMVADLVTQGRITLHYAACNFHGFVRRVVEHLNVQLFARVIQFADRLHQAVDHELLIENGQLDGNAREFLKMGFRLADRILAVAVIHPDELVSVEAIAGQNDEDNKVRHQQQHVEAVGLIESLESGIRLLLQKLHDCVRMRLRDEGKCRYVGNQLHDPA